MNNNIIAGMADIIDSRTLTSKAEYCGVITSVGTGFKKGTVKLSGTEREIELLNKTGEKLYVGDSVIVKAIGGNMSNAYIEYRFGAPDPLGQSITIKVNEPTGRWATSEYYTNYYGAFIGDGLAVILMTGGTSTDYENIEFDKLTNNTDMNIEFVNQTVYEYPSADAGQLYATIISGVERDIVVDLNLRSRIASYDAVMCELIINEE